MGCCCRTGKSDPVTPRASSAVTRLAVLSAITKDEAGLLATIPTVMPIPNLPSLGNVRSTTPPPLARIQRDSSLPVPDVAADPTQLVARALAILAEETDSWQKRRVPFIVPPT